jgi:hypothetical protein
MSLFLDVLMTLLQLLRLCNLMRKNGLAMTVIWEWFGGSGCGLLKVILVREGS